MPVSKFRETRRQYKCLSKYKRKTYSSENVRGCKLYDRSAWLWPKIDRYLEKWHFFILTRKSNLSLTLSVLPLNSYTEALWKLDWQSLRHLTECQVTLYRVRYIVPAQLRIKLKVMSLSYAQLFCKSIRTTVSKPSRFVTTEELMLKSIMIMISSLPIAISAIIVY